ncbi:hypothetical protein BT69DRAFT_1350730 [Atractiella rhizophila]|nr:hypothetical protein BT69DRAFT_1350730 [Atractiella rhizophila]
MNAAASVSYTAQLTSYFAKSLAKRKSPTSLSRFCRSFLIDSTHKPTLTSEIPRAFSRTPYRFHSRRNLSTLPPEIVELLSDPAPDSEATQSATSASRTDKRRIPPIVHKPTPAIPSTFTDRRVGFVPISETKGYVTGVEPSKSYTGSNEDFIDYFKERFWNTKSGFRHRRNTRYIIVKKRNDPSRPQFLIEWESFQVLATVYAFVSRHQDSFPFKLFIRGNLFPLDDPWTRNLVVDGISDLETEATILEQFAYLDPIKVEIHTKSEDSRIASIWLRSNADLRRGLRQGPKGEKEKEGWSLRYSASAKMIHDAIVGEIPEWKPSKTAPVEKKKKEKYLLVQLSAALDSLFSSR